MIFTGRGKRINEKGVDLKTGKVVIEVDPKYFRPTEVETLLGDPSKAKEVLDWKPKTKFEDLVKIMTSSDFEKVKSRGY